MKPILLCLVILASSFFAGKADEALGTGELPSVAPDGHTALHLVADGTRQGTLVGSSRYVGWLENPMQGFLFDRITRQSWYIYAQYGEPGSEQISWYAQDLHKPMPEWVEVLPLKEY